jgi:hypothetical protein
MDPKDAQILFDHDRIDNLINSIKVHSGHWGETSINAINLVYRMARESDIPHTYVGVLIDKQNNTYEISYDIYPNGVVKPPKTRRFHWQ